MTDDPLEILATSIDREAVEQEIAKLRAEIEVRGARVTKLITLLGLLPERENVVSSDSATVAEQTTIRPSLADAVLIVMRERPSNVLWTSDTMLARLDEKGWTPGGKTPRNSIDATFSRLRKAGQVQRPMPGMYNLPSSDGATAAGNSAATTPEGTGEEV
jgi:hypothetical protein